MKQETRPTDLYAEFVALEEAAIMHANAYVGIGDGCLSVVLERMRGIVDALKNQGASEEDCRYLALRMDARIRY